MHTQTPKKKSPNRLAYGVSLGLAFGAAIGAAIGIFTKNTGLWLPICTSIGCTLGIAVGSVLDESAKPKRPAQRRRLTNFPEN